MTLRDDRSRSVFASPLHLIAAVLLAVLGIGALYIHKKASFPAALVWGLPVGVIVVADGYIALILWIAACVSQGTNKLRRFLPHRTTALLMLLMFAIALILSFAGLYIETNSIKAAADKAVLSTVTDAIYFSVVTITTLGYGDFTPQSTCAKYIVISELASGILLLIGALPLVVSRLSNLGDDAADQTRAVDKKGREITFHALKISFPKRDDDELTINDSTLAWRRFGLVLTVTKTASGEFTYRRNDEAPAFVKANKTLVFDRQGEIK